MLSGGKWGVNGVCMRGQRPRASRREERGASWGPEDERENEESLVACRIWTTCSCTAHSVRALAIMYDRGRVIKVCRTTVSVG